MRDRDREREERKDRRKEREEIREQKGGPFTPHYPSFPAPHLRLSPKEILEGRWGSFPHKAPGYGIVQEGRLHIGYSARVPEIVRVL